MQQRLKSEKGVATMVEATLMLPFCALAVVGVLYASLYICQRANVQANLELALTYYKSQESDTYVSAKDSMEYGETGLEGRGSSYGSPAYLNPYRFFTMKFKESGFKSFFFSVCGHMFFDDGDDLVFEKVEKHNYVFYKTIEASVSQEVRPPINLSMIGGPEYMTIQATGKAVISDGDDFIRNADFAIDILADTKLGELAQNAAGKVQEIYGKFKSFLGEGD